MQEAQAAWEGKVEQAESWEVEVGCALPEAAQSVRNLTARRLAIELYRGGLSKRDYEKMEALRLLRQGYDTMSTLDWDLLSWAHSWARVSFQMTCLCIAKECIYHQMYCVLLVCASSYFSWYETEFAFCFAKLHND